MAGALETRDEAPFTGSGKEIEKAKEIEKDTFEESKCLLFTRRDVHGFGPFVRTTVCES